ncbi:MAG: putative TetR family transcriptional regulator [Marmoricola sp.]|nr:putative TetR family transcriptional regulator [Marmoricola sp.]
MDRDRKILSTAAAMFYDKGFHGVGMDELGVAAGMSGPSLYRHFGSKNEILAALFNEAMDQLYAATFAAPEDASSALDQLVRHHVAFTVGNRHLVNVYQREDRSLVDPWRRHFDRRRRQYVERWDALVAARFPDADRAEVSVRTQAALGLIFSIAYWPAKVAADPRVSTVLVEQVLEALRPHDPT